MASLAQSATFTTNRAPSDVFATAKRWLASKASTRVVSETPEQLEIVSGSQLKMRLIGGAFIAATSLPVRTVIDARPAAGGGSAVTVPARDSVGFGFKTGMKGKYEGWLREILDGVQQAALAAA